MIGNFGDFVVYLMTVGCCTKVATSSANDEQNIAYPSKWKGGESLDIIAGNRKKGYLLFINNEEIFNLGHDER